MVPAEDRQPLARDVPACQPQRLRPGDLTPLTGDTGPTRYAIDEFGFALPLVIGMTAIWFWTKRDVALVSWRAAEALVEAPADRALHPAAV